MRPCAGSGLGPREPARRYGLATLGHAALVLCGVAGIVAGVSYSSFLLAPWIGSRLSVADSFVSELEANGQRNVGFFRASDVVAGALMIVLAVGLAGMLDVDLYGVLGCASLALVGLGSIGDALTAVRCGPATDPGCARSASIATQFGDVHTVTSSIGVVGTMATMALLGTHLYRRHRWISLAWLSWTCAAMMLLLSTTDGILILSDHGFGLSERMHVLLMSIWLVAVGWHVAAHPLRHPHTR
jgi:hypothetical protein